MLPAISGNCPTCGSDDVRTLSRSPATYEVFNQCGACGEDWWEEESRAEVEERKQATAERDPRFSRFAA